MTLRRTSLGLLVALAVAFPATSVASIWPNDADWVERGLESEDVVERREAASHLAELPGQRGERLMLRALLDDDVEVRLSAAGALERKSVAAPPDIALAWLGERDARLRVLAIDLLARAEPTPELVQALGRALGDPDLEVRVRAASALGASMHPSAVLALLGHVDEPNMKMQLAVIEALLELRDPRAVVALVSKVQDARAEVREAVARALASFDGERVAASLGLLLRDGDDRVRLAAVTSLGRVAGGQSTDAIVHAVNTDDNLDVRIAAVHALGRTRSPRAAEVLVDLLDGPRGEVALEAKLVLGTMGAHATAELRACLLGQPSRARADACVHALARTGDGEAALAIADAWRRRVCSADAALESFGVLGDARVLPAVLESLGDADPWVRRRAIVALFVLLDPEAPDGRAVEPLLAAAQGAAQRPDELLLLVDLLGRTGASRIAPELLTYARSPRPRLRVAALQALGMVRAQGAERLLLDALDGAEPAERRAAALALYRAGSKDAVPSLLRKLDASSGEDVEWVLLALRGTVSRSSDPDIGAELERRLASATGPRRDALLEVLVVSRGAASALERVARGGGARSRAKVAELVAALPEARPLALELARDQGAVRENALWSLGFIGATSDLDFLADAIRDAAPRAAANAAVSFGRLARKDSDPAPLCQALDHGAAAVRTSVLTALRLSGLGCRGRERALLLDRSRFVRLAAAELLADRRSDADIAGLLARCADEDRDARVAEACRSEPAQALPSGPAVTTFVWSAGGTEPVPGLSYALRLADGSMRHGLADRRGAVHESKPAKGELSLEVPLLDAAE